jgi:hypothetical protein
LAGESPLEPKHNKRKKPICPVRAAIQEEVVRTLDEYVKLTFRQIEFLESGDHKSALEMDADLERKHGEKERAFRALLQHLDEHGC